MTFQPQPLRPHAPYVFIKFVDFFVQLIVFRFQFVVAAQLSERFLNGEFGCFGHADLIGSFLDELDTDCARWRRNLP
jgi:hypothetical protein